MTDRNPDETQPPCTVDRPQLGQQAQGDNSLPAAAEPQSAWVGAPSAALTAAQAPWP